MSFIWKGTPIFAYANCPFHNFLGNNWTFMDNGHGLDLWGCPLRLLISHMKCIISYVFLTKEFNAEKIKSLTNLENPKSPYLSLCPRMPIPISRFFGYNKWALGNGVPHFFNYNIENKQWQLCLDFGYKEKSAKFNIIIELNDIRSSDRSKTI